MKNSREAKQKQKSHKAIKTFRHLPTKMMILVPSCTGEFQFQKRIDIALCCDGMLFTSRAIATRLHQNHLYHLVFCLIQANIRFYRNTTAASDSVLTQFFYLFCECSLLPIYNWRCTLSTFCTHTHIYWQPRSETGGKEWFDEKRNSARNCEERTSCWLVKAHIYIETHLKSIDWNVMNQILKSV